MLVVRNHVRGAGPLRAVVRIELAGIEPFAPNRAHSFLQSADRATGSLGGNRRNPSVRSNFCKHNLDRMSTWPR